MKKISFFILISFLITSGVNAQASQKIKNRSGLKSKVSKPKNKIDTVSVTKIQKENPKLFSAFQQRNKAVDYYFGKARIDISQISYWLEPAVIANDELAKMWKGVFYYMGLGGYSTNEDSGKQLIIDSKQAVLDSAQNGLPEAKYLLSFAYLIEGKASGKITADNYLKEALTLNYAPAFYTYGIQLYANKNYDSAFSYLNDAYTKGIKKAAASIGMMYEKGYFKERDVEKAVDWYKKGAIAGDGDAMLKISKLYSSGEDMKPDNEQVIKWSKQAIQNKNIGAMMFLADYYLGKNDGISANKDTALRLYNTAAESGDREAMFGLGLLYHDGKSLGYKDGKNAFYWIKKAAEASQPQAMAMLGVYYGEGENCERSVIKSRYWLNESELNGSGVGNAKPKTESPLVSAFKYGDFSSKAYIYEDNWGNTEVVETGPDIFGGIIGGVFQGWANSRMNQQEIIDGLEFVRTKNGTKIYAGTVTSSFQTTLSLREGDKVNFIAYGTVSLGMFAGSAGPSGLNSNMFDSYSRVRGINHGALIAKIGDSNWFSVSQTKSITISNEGLVYFAINDVDYSNNQGYFDIKIEIR